MKTKNIFKTLAAAMLLPAMLLTTACSSEDDFAGNENTENAAKKGYTLPVTVNVTRQGDEATTRAAFNSETKKLEFSTGDKLFVSGSQATAGSFAGTLDYVSDGTFSGTITTENEYTGTVDDLFASAYAYLLPNGYADYGYLSISGSGYSAYHGFDMTKAFALSKAAAVEQLSQEWAYGYSSGFALEPNNAILNFTISGLAASAEVAVVFTIYDYGEIYATITGNVTTDASGTATFAIGVEDGTELKDCTLTVDGNAITLVSSSKEVAAGKIYNITRSAAPAGPKAAAAATAEDLGKLIGADGNIYDDAAAASAAGTTALAKIMYVGSDAETDATYNHGLALALSDVSEGQYWCDQSSNICLTTQYSSSAATGDMAGIANTEALVNHGSHTHAAASAARGYNSSIHPTGTSEWFLPSAGQWVKMATAAGGYANLKTNADLQENTYWSSTESTEYGSGNAAWYVSISGNKLDCTTKNYFNWQIRACLAF